MTYKCDTCTRQARKSNGIYVRCRYFGDIKKRIECGKYNYGSVAVAKMGFLDSIEKGLTV